MGRLPNLSTYAIGHRSNCLRVLAKKAIEDVERKKRKRLGLLSETENNSFKSFNLSSPLAIKIAFEHINTKTFNNKSLIEQKSILLAFLNAGLRYCENSQKRLETLKKLKEQTEVCTEIEESLKLLSGYILDIQKRLQTIDESLSPSFIRESASGAFSPNPEPKSEQKTDASDNSFAILTPNETQRRSSVSGKKSELITGPLAVSHRKIKYNSAKNRLEFVDEEGFFLGPASVSSNASHYSAAVEQKKHRRVRSNFNATFRPKRSDITIVSTERVEKKLDNEDPHFPVFAYTELPEDIHTQLNPLISHAENSKFVSEPLVSTESENFVVINFADETFFEPYFSKKDHVSYIGEEEPGKLCCFSIALIDEQEKKAICSRNGSFLIDMKQRDSFSVDNSLNVLATASSNVDENPVSNPSHSSSVSPEKSFLGESAVSESVDDDEDAEEDVEDEALTSMKRNRTQNIKYGSSESQNSLAVSNETSSQSISTSTPQPQPLSQPTSQLISTSTDSNTYLLCLYSRSIANDMRLIVSLKSANKIDLVSSSVKRRVLRTIFNDETKANKVEHKFKLLPGTKQLTQSLISYEESQIFHNMKFGLVYCKNGQTFENDLLSNQYGSKAFYEFCDIIGDIIQLEGWNKYRGGLRGGMTGEHSVYTEFKGYCLMFHVAPLLPFDDTDLQQIEKKRHIGNDICIIVFKEGNRPLPADFLTSHFTHIVLIVSPVYRDEKYDKEQDLVFDAKESEKSEINLEKRKIEHDGKVTEIVFENDPSSPKDLIGYRCEIAIRSDVPSFSPQMPKNGFVFDKTKTTQLREFLLCKLINAELSTYEGIEFRSKFQNVRKELLKDIQHTFMKKK